MPNSDRDSSSGHSEEPDSPIDDEIEEVEEEVEEEWEEEVEEEEEEEEEQEEIGEDEKGEEEEVEDEGEDEDDEELEEEEKEEEEEEADEEEESRDDEQINDASKQMESERHCEDLKLVSSTIGKSGSNLATPIKDVTGDCFSLVKIRSANGKEASDASVVDVQPAVQEKQISSKEKGCSKSQGEERDMGVSLEKKTSGEDPGHLKNSYLQAPGSGQSHLSSGGSISSESTAPLQVHNKGLDETNIAKGGTIVGKSNGILEMEVLHLDPKSELKIQEDPSLSSIHTPQRRPRSSSPSGTSENLSKKPAIACSFYARGWCIKGSSCRFLHLKEGGEEDLAEPSMKEDVLDGTGSGGEAERLRISSSQERPDLSISENSSKSELQMQRSLVRAYGGESHGPTHLHGGEEFRKVDTPQVVHSLIQDEYKSSLGVSSRSDMDDNQSAKEHFLSRKYLHGEQLQQELPKREFLNDSPFPRGSSLAKSSIVPEDRYYSGGSSMPSSLFRNNNPFALGRRTDDVAFLDHQSRFPLHGSQSSYSLSRSLNTAFNSPYQHSPGLSFTSERLEINKTFDFGKESHGSGSAFLRRSSSPYFPRPEVENGLLHSMPRDLPAFRQRMEAHENSWEPSIPFRPSIHYAPPSFSSPGSQYDPLLDSIEPRNTGNVALQASERAININISDHSTKGDTLLLYKSQIPEHRVERPISSFPHPQEGNLTRSKPADGLCTKPSLAATPGHTVTDGRNSSAYKEDHDHIVESADVNGAERGGILRYQGDQSKTTKESKAMKIFRSALVNFVKELVKPSWREGNLSKDAHKKVVKKAVEKVLSALQTHQVPDTTESINQYLSTSRPKILKLVEGYVEKYSKD